MAQGWEPLGPKIWQLIELHDKHPEAVEAELIRAGLRWRDDHGPGWTPWADIWAIIRTASWDSPLAQAMEPENWAWYGPMSAVLIETRDLLRVMATKQYPHPKVRREQIPSLTVPPWRTDENRSKFAPEPVTKDEIDAHLMRINGRTPNHRAHVEPAPTPAPRFRDVDVEQMRVMLADGLSVERVAAFFGASKEFVGEIGRITG